MTIVAPSLLAADFSNLSEHFIWLNTSKAEWIHLDIMDGHFVPNLSFGIPIIQSCRKLTNKIFDVHLMLSNPDKYFDSFIAAGANNISFHIEAVQHPLEQINYLKSKQITVGLAINPDTPINIIFPYLKNIDFVCLMSVYPGFGGQKFIENSILKMEQLNTEIKHQNLHTKIEVDGGVTEQNAPEIVKAGANILVAGNTIFNAPDPVKVIENLYFI
ncbi:MAG: ribulose-phosphate 3-epimerase [Sediminibacterium sp.]|nr:ribulose-phosphate 3-epimerase [Sediminibacterium sp.]